MEILEPTILNVLFRAFLGLVIGFCIGLTGIGGGVLVLPSLTLLLGMNSVMAVGTASLYALLPRVSATFHHARLKTVDWKLSFVFLTGAVPVNLIVAPWIAAQGDDPAFASTLKNVIIGTVFFCVSIMIFNLIRQLRDKRGGSSKFIVASYLDKHSAHRLALGIVSGVIVGALIAATSIGGGVLIVPILMMVFGLEARTTVGSSIFIAVVLTLFTSLSYFSGENSMDAVTAVIMAAGSLVGVPIGSKLSVTLGDKLLQILVIIVIIIAAFLMLFSGSSH